MKTADEAYNEALEIVRSTDGWKVEKEDKANNVIVEMKKNSKGRKIYRCKVRFKMVGVDLIVSFRPRSTCQPSSCRRASRTPTTSATGTKLSLLPKF